MHTNGLPETAEKEGLSPLEYMRKFGAYLVYPEVYVKNEDAVSDDSMNGATFK